MNYSQNTYLNLPKKGEEGMRTKCPLNLKKNPITSMERVNSLEKK